MKILHVIPSVSPIYGGPSQAIGSMTSALAAQGLQVDVATTTANGNSELDVPLSAPVLESGVRTFYFPRQFPKWWTFSWPLTRWLSKNAGNYDLLHIHALFNYPTLVASQIARNAKVSYILRPLGTMSPWSISQKKLRKKIYYRLFERQNLFHAAAIHATSHFEARYLQRLGLKAKVHIIPLGIEKTSLPRRQTLSNKPPRLLFLSRLDAKKGLSLLIQSLASLSKKGMNAHLTIAGNGNPGYLSQLKEKVRNLGLVSQVEFVGFVEGEKKTQLFAESDIFVLPSSDENFGLAVAEAMAAGLPVVVSDQVGISPEVQEYSAGVVVKCTVDSVKEGLERLIIDPELCSKMGKQGEQLVKERFAWDKVAGQLTEFYEKILSHRV